MHCQEEILRAHSAISTSSDAKANDADLNLDSSGKPSGVPPQDLLVVLGESSSVDTRSPSPSSSSMRDIVPSQPCTRRLNIPT